MIADALLEMIECRLPGDALLEMIERRLPGDGGQCADAPDDQEIWEVASYLDAAVGRFLVSILEARLDTGAPHLYLHRVAMALHELQESFHLASYAVIQQLEADVS